MLRRFRNAESKALRSQFLCALPVAASWQQAGGLGGLRRQDYHKRGCKESAPKPSTLGSELPLSCYWLAWSKPETKSLEVLVTAMLIEKPTYDMMYHLTT